MAPKSKGKGEKKSSVPSATKAPVNYTFPSISEKVELECSVVMEDQILIIEVSSESSVYTYFLIEVLSTRRNFSHSKSVKNM